MNTEEIKSLLDSLADYIPQASQWEQGFFESVKAQFDRKHTLSDRQVETVQKIAGKFSPAAIQERKAWYESFTDLQRETMRVCADYYKGTGYYKDLVHSILSNSEFVPSPKQYKILCENKYAAKVLDAYRSEPKFPVGSLATLRKIRSNGYMAISGAPAWRDINVLVLTTNEPIVSSAKGAKRYKCMIVGGTDTFYCEERDLKRMKRGKK
tara:strand:- start:733 stop:1362 length:630 start_codon:yes stop_codon:yes gene_type:complete